MKYILLPILLLVGCASAKKFQKIQGAQVPPHESERTFMTDSFVQEIPIQSPAVEHATVELLRQEEMIEPLGQAVEKLENLKKSIGGFLASEKLQAEWDADASLAYTQLKVAADRETYSETEGGPLRVSLAASGPLSDILFARFRDRFAEQGFEVLASNQVGSEDAHIQVHSATRELEGGRPGLRSWKGELEMAVYSRSAWDQKRVLVAQKRYSSNDPVYGVEPESVGRKILLPWVGQGVDLAAERILSNQVATIPWTISFYSGADNRDVVTKLWLAFQKQAPEGSLHGLGPIQWTSGRTSFNVSVDRRLRGQLGAILEGLALSGSRRVRVISEANQKIHLRIVTI